MKALSWAASVLFPTIGTIGYNRSLTAGAVCQLVVTDVINSWYLLNREAQEYSEKGHVRGKIIIQVKEE